MISDVKKTKFILQPQIRSEADIINWWIAQRETYPRLFLLAMDVPPVPASSERANSLVALLSIRGKRLTT